ncbi:MAG: 30S ribosomal protein S6 [Acidobacteria bacterium]|nr:30S ribosomal protein S6 [Acidobacteriota bacterium]
MANNRVYEVMYIAEPDSKEDVITKLNEEIIKLVEGEGGTIVKTDDMGKRPLAYRIKKFTEGYYYLFEIEGSGREIAEVERRMRVNDKIIRYLTVRVDEERKTALKVEAKRNSGKKEISDDGVNGDEEE